MVGLSRSPFKEMSLKKIYFSLLLVYIFYCYTLVTDFKKYLYIQYFSNNHIKILCYYRAI